MFGAETTITPRKTGQWMARPMAPSGPKLVGYVLSLRTFEDQKEATLHLQQRCARAGFAFSVAESDAGTPLTNPFRKGLWTALRRLMCTRCEPKRMPFSMMNFEDFIHQSLMACPCGSNSGAAGIVVNRLDELSADKKSASALVLTFAKRGKHLVAEDGICLSCCHPETKKLL